MSQNTGAHVERHSKWRICGQFYHLNMYWGHKVIKCEVVSGTLDYLTTLCVEKARRRCIVIMQQYATCLQKCTECSQQIFDVLLTWCIQQSITLTHTLIWLACKVLLYQSKVGRSICGQSRDQAPICCTGWDWDSRAVWMNRMGGETDIWHEWNTKRLLETKQI